MGSACCKSPSLAARATSKLCVADDIMILRYAALKPGLSARASSMVWFGRVSQHIRVVHLRRAFTCCLLICFFNNRIGRIQGDKVLFYGR